MLKSSLRRLLAARPARRGLRAVPGQLRGGAEVQHAGARLLPAAAADDGVRGGRGGAEHDAGGKAGVQDEVEGDQEQTAVVKPGPGPIKTLSAEREHLTVKYKTEQR